MDALKVFYRQEQSCAEPYSYSPSAGKPALVVADWKKEFGEQISVESFAPATRQQIYAAHSPEYVDGVFAGTRKNGFGNKSVAVAASLPYTCGSLIAACQHVLTTDEKVACSPTSGFHHAYYKDGGGFCTFNGLMIAAIEMHRSGLAKKILILDYDQHFGDGTEDIIRTLGIDYVKNVTASRSYEDATELMQSIEEIRSGYDLVIFQAGADIHVDDPLGGILTTEQMDLRDQKVFSECRATNTPVVFNLAGGYQREADGSIPKVLALHRTTLSRAVAANGYVWAALQEA